MIALVATTDAVKLSAIQALLDSGGVETRVFDTAAGGLWRGLIPCRLMIDPEDQVRARALLRQAGFIEAADGDWDLAPGATL